MEIGIIGSGNVGITTAFALAEKGSGHITLYDRTDGRAQGKALDLAEAGPIRRYDRRIRGTNELADLFDSDVLIVAAGKPRTEGMERFDLLEDNRCFIQDLANKLKHGRTNPEPPATIVLTEPVDVMTGAFVEASGWPRESILGMGGLLSTSRMRHFIARELNMSASDVDAMVVGTHSDKMVVLERFCRISGLPIDRFLSREQIDSIIERTVTAGTAIVEHAKRGSSFYTPGAAVGAVVHAIVTDSNRIFPISVLLDGEYGESGICASVPVKVGRGGVKQILELDLTDEEQQRFAESLEVQRPHIQKVEEGVCHE